jgi:predicted nucleotidyltransferase
MTTLADLSGVSLAHVARIVPRLVDLGVVERRDVPPAALVRLTPDNLAARGIVALAELRHTLLDELRTSAETIEPAPVSVTLFGSFARGDDDAASDIDVVVVRPASVDEEDPRWSGSIGRWESLVRPMSGNPVNRVEVAEDEVPKLVRSRRPLWAAIVREGITLQGRPLAEVEAATRG